MFSYYGSKNRIAKIYPKPIYNKIIEPFAGAANYSLLHFENDILLCDKSNDIISIWKYLQSASTKDILSLPKVNSGQRIIESDYDCPEQYRLMRYLISQGAHHGTSLVSKWGGLRFESNRNRVVKNLYKIKHWKFVCDDYQNLKNEVATWFIDAPYLFGGEKYPHSSKKINFEELANYAKNRLGQTIVCENTKANWLPFVPMKTIRGVQHNTTEVIWSNYQTNFDNIQQKLIL